jgi:hypothetical protein
MFPLSFVLVYIQAFKGQRQQYQYNWKVQQKGVETSKEYHESNRFFWQWQKGQHQSKNSRSCQKNRQ